MEGSESFREPVYNVRRYLLLGVLALAIPLAGLLGGHRLVAAIFGPGEDGETLAAPASLQDACPPDRYTADACDKDDEHTPPAEQGPACGAPGREDSMPRAPRQVRSTIVATVGRR